MISAEQTSVAHDQAQKMHSDLRKPVKPHSIQTLMVRAQRRHRCHLWSGEGDQLIAAQHQAATMPVDAIVRILNRNVRSKPSQPLGLR